MGCIRIVGGYDRESHSEIRRRLDAASIEPRKRARERDCDGKSIPLNSFTNRHNDTFHLFSVIATGLKDCDVEWAVDHCIDSNEII